MFRIKICGITTPDDARMVAAAGADAVGLNFYARSPRSIGLDTARQIIDALPSGVVRVGLFVNSGSEDVCRTFDRLGLNLIQLHGDEPPKYLAELSVRPVMRAFRLDEAGLEPVIAYLQQCRGLSCLPRLVLLDAHQKGIYGGTGRVADWATVALYAGERRLPPLVLAGGLTPDNVAQAIRTARPAAVDTASGVETNPGCKDPGLVGAFVRAAREALRSR